MGGDCGPGGRVGSLLISIYCYLSKGHCFVNGCTVDRTPRTYIPAQAGRVLLAYSRLCAVLGADFVPYLPGAVSALQGLLATGTRRPLFPSKLDHVTQTRPLFPSKLDHATHTCSCLITRAFCSSWRRWRGCWRRQGSV